jgi:hypothetical protein
MKFILEHINLYEKVLEKFENAIESDEKIEFDKEYI